MKKNIKIIITTIMMMVTISIVSLADNYNGMTPDGYFGPNNTPCSINGDGGERLGFYSLIDDKPVANQWISIANYDYYLTDESGLVYTNYWVKEGENWYYLDEAGIMVRNNALKFSTADGVMYALEKNDNSIQFITTLIDDSLWYAFGDNGLYEGTYTDGELAILQKAWEEAAEIERQLGAAKADSFYD